MVEVGTIKSFGSLNNGTFFSICELLDIKSLLNFSSTCRELRGWINNQDYWKIKCISAYMVERKRKKNQKVNIDDWKELYISKYKKLCIICNLRIGKRIVADHRIWCDDCSNTHPDGYILVRSLMKEYNLSSSDFSVVMDRMVHRHKDPPSDHRPCLIKRNDVLQYIVNNYDGDRPDYRWSSVKKRRGEAEERRQLKRKKKEGEKECVTDE